jgi:uncharacterized repeat protein (TIGR01451 family)
MRKMAIQFLALALVLGAQFPARALLSIAEFGISAVDSPDPVATGSALVYTITVRNSGPSGSSGVVTDSLPAGVSFVSASPACMHRTGVVTCNVTLTSGSSAILNLTVTTSTVGTITNTFSVATRATDLSKGNNVTQVTTKVDRSTPTSAPNPTPAPAPNPAPAPAPMPAPNPAPAPAPMPAPNPAPAPALTPARGPLAWAPPTGWESYREYIVPSGGGTIDLPDSRTDYRISAPYVITNPVHLRGGRNVVWIGGHIRIEDKGSLASGISRRALAISDAKDGSSVDRLVHLEGLLLDGNDLSEGVNTNCPKAIVQLENTHIAAVKLRGADDRDGTGGYPSASHPDIIQIWGSQRELRIDGLTGRSNYQGLFLYESTSNPVRGSIRLRNVNIEMVESTGEDGYRYAGQRGYYMFTEYVGQQFIDNGTVWISHHRNSGWVGGRYYRSAFRDSNGRLVADPPPGTSSLYDNVYPAPVIDKDDLGTYASWLDSVRVSVNGKPAVRNWGDTGPGKIYSGSPSGGDYVPAASVGLNYERPGA